MSAVCIAYFLCGLLSVLCGTPCFISSDNFPETLMLFHCCKNQSLIFVMRCRNTRVLRVPQLPHSWRKYVEIITGASWNMHIHVFINSYVAWLPL
jgi:hypothetical protein